MIEQCVSLNTAIYLLVKSTMAQEEEGEDSQVIDSHPVMLQLKRINSTIDKFGDRVSSKADSLQDQMRNLVKASLLMESSEDMQVEEDQDDPAPAEDEKSDDGVEADFKEETTKPSKSFSQANEAHPRLEVLGEARFGLRHHEIDLVQSKKRRGKATDLDFGDAGENGESSRALAVTINAIEQRAARKPKNVEGQSTMQSDHYDEGGNEVADGLKMMEDELGAESDSDSLQGLAEHGKDDMRRTKDDPLGGMQFYNAMAATAERKKEMKKDMHRVAPKFPRSETEVAGKSGTRFVSELRNFALTFILPRRRTSH
jgi:hypothetical protein